ncbi:PilN domain-containing protein [Celerinatantimonas sp. MCCC 1A17872]|uniref:PilN domain-containing protein n=1 Tax=Celerinatantimonas sp. MCCC 1A17872 TaxID=3177514 RepID=UPI0038BE5D76
MISQSFDMLAQRWRHSVGDRLWHWWLSELGSLLPTFIRSRLIVPVEPVSWPLQKEVLPGSKVRLVLPEQALMVTQLWLPVRQIANARQMVFFQLDQYTPFGAADVCFDISVIERRDEQLLVSFAAIKRSHLARILNSAKELKLSVEAVDVSSNDQSMGLNLLHSYNAQQRTKAVKAKRLGWLLAIVLIALLWAQWQWRTSERLQLMRQEVSAKQAQVMALVQQKEQILARQQAVKSLLDLRQNQPAISPLLADLTQCLPNDSWLTSLSVQSDKKVTFTGQTANPAQLLKQLQQCKSITAPQFQGMIRPSSADGMNYFTIQARQR